MEKIELVIKRMRWKAIHFNNNEDNKEECKPKWFGLKSFYSPKQVKELIPFENDLIEILRNIKFRRVRNNFQKKLKDDINQVRASNKTMTFADKTSNMYRLNKDEYDKLINNSITSTYKKANKNISKQVNKAGKTILKNKEVIKRMEINTEANCFITLKDHKENFANNPTVRLINPAKNELGRISKVILDKINKSIRESFKFNQWKNTDTVIDWFKQINNKQAYKFIIFDIKEFYPSITENLLKKALDFSAAHTELSEEDKTIIYHSRKSLLFNNQHVWIKKEGGLFDVTMGAFDGAEVCELVGNFILHQLSMKFNKNDFGLYRDDGLGVLKNKSGPEAEKIKKEIQKLFKENHLNITIKCNLKIVDYLDVTFNLSNATYRPFCKPNNEILYVHKESNHPPSILKQIPLSIESRLSKLSSSESIFKESTHVYQEALYKSGYNHKLSYQNANKNTQISSNRKRNIIWFNPPYSKNVATKVGNQFLKLISKHFPRHHKFHKIFNKNNVKVSYSCMPNMKSIINMHNRKIISPKINVQERKCNCINKASCPLKEKCLTNSLVYKAKIKSTGENSLQKTYYGLSETKFKTRFANHKKTFKNPVYKTDTELSNEYWNIKSKNQIANITWEIFGQYQSYNPITKRCALCLNEKLAIALHKDGIMLNKRSEIINKCRHRNKYALASYDTKD